MLRFLPPSLSVNPVVRVLIVSDFFILAGIGFLAPVLPIFIAEEIAGGSTRVSGFAAAIYMLMWVFQLPVGWFLDSRGKERDDFIFIVLGSLITAISLALFIFAKTPLHIYLIQALAGFSRAIDLPAWYSIFTKKIDRHKESYEWSLENITVGLALAAVGAASGLIAERYGFQVLFLVAAALTFMGSVVLFLLYPRPVVSRGHHD